MPGTLVCAQCHMVLGEGSVTKQLGSVDLPHLSSPGTIKFAQHMRLLIKINDAKLDLPIDEQLTVGRAQDGLSGKPDVDLSPYDAFNKGVSRWHALFKRDDQMLSITDTGSSNGTWVNGERLRTGVPKVLSDGDTLWFGLLRVDVYFYYA